MIPAFTIVTTLITIAVTGVLMLVLWRINAPMLRRHRENDAAGTGLVLDGSHHGRSRHDDNSDGGSDGGGSDGGGDGSGGGD